jgi:hypothetical protein
VASIFDFEELHDFDGIGALFEQNEVTEETTTSDKQQELLIDPDDELDQINAAEEQHQQPEAAAATLASLDNYGLGYNAASISIITDLTSV